MTFAKAVQQECLIVGSLRYLDIVVPEADGDAREVAGVVEVNTVGRCHHPAGRHQRAAAEVGPVNPHRDLQHNRYRSVQ